MNLLNDIKLAESDDIIALLNYVAISDDSIINTIHHEADDEFKDLFNHENDYDFYVSRMYNSMVHIYTDMMIYVKKCESLSICNDLLKSHISELETTRKYSNSLFVLNDADDEHLFSS